MQIVDPSHPVDYGSTSPTGAPPETILDTAKTGTDFTQTDIELGVEKVIDYGNKVIPWTYGKGLQISGGVVKGAGIYTKRLGVENLGDAMIKAGEHITPKDYATTPKR